MVTEPIFSTVGVHGALCRTDSNTEMKGQGRKRSSGALAGVRRASPVKKGLILA